MLRSSGPRLRRSAGASRIAGLITALALACMFCASASAATYSQTQTMAVPPASSFNASAGGDGWDVSLSNDKVFNVFHHNNVMTVNCHLQTDASVCDGFPFTVTDALGRNFRTSGHPGTIFGSDGKLRIYGTRVDDNVTGVVCVDPDMREFCGFTELTGSGEGGATGNNWWDWSLVSQPMLVGTHWYAFNYVPDQPAGGDSGSGSQNRVLCFDVATAGPCSGQPYSVNLGSGKTANRAPSPATAVIANKLIIPRASYDENYNSSDSVACFDPVTNGDCQGSWPAPLDQGVAGGSGGAFPKLDATGTTTGFCFPTGTHWVYDPSTGWNPQGEPCYDLSGTSVPTPDGMSDVITASDGWNGSAVTIGPRVYVPNGNVNGIQCWDYSTGSNCASFPKYTDGSWYPYTVNSDPQRPTCLWVNGDSGYAQIQSFDAYSGGACGAGSTRVLTSQYIVPQEKCYPATYQNLQVTSPDPSNYSGGTVEFADGAGNPIPGVSPVQIDGTGTADLTGLNLNGGAGLPQFVITLNNPGADVGQLAVKLSWTASYDPACVKAGTTVDKKPTASSGLLSDGASTSSTLSVSEGTPVTDQIAVTGDNAASIGGTVRYTWFSDAACTSVASTGADQPIGSAGSTPASAPVSLAGGTYHLVASYSGDAGNLASQTACGDQVLNVISPDSTPPVTKDDAPTGWQGTDVSVHLTATDDKSGVAATHYTVDNSSEQTGTVVSVSGSGTHAISYYSVDNAGNKESPNSTTVKIDETDPTISGAADPAANGAGWNSQITTVKFVCDDKGSGIALCDGGKTINYETAGEQVAGSATDNVGRTANASVSVKVDLTKPTLSGDPTTQPNGHGWYNGDVAIVWHALDGLSGVDNSTVPASDAITAEGSNQTVGPKTVKDIAGNESAPTVSKPVSIDRAPPSIQASIPGQQKNAAGWYNQPVTVHFDCADALSGKQECTGDTKILTDGTNQSRTGEATDNADNTASATASGINIDTVAPKSTAKLSCGNDNYCGNSGTVHIAASDLAPADGVVPSHVKRIEYRVNPVADSDPWTSVKGDSADVTVPLSGVGTAKVEYRAVDVADNTESVNTATIKYDTIPPTVSHKLDPAPNSAGWNNANTTVTFSATDGVGSGVVSLTDPQLISNETLGLDVMGTATDQAGNTGTDQVTVHLDKTNPTIGASASGTSGSHGWWTSPVKVHFTCVDAGLVKSGVANCASDQVLDNGQTATGRLTDNAGNQAGTSYGPVPVDTQAPDISVKGVADGGIYQLGAVPAASCTAVDRGASGIDGGCQITVSGGLANGVGKYTFAATAKDMAGNSTALSGTYQVRYAVKSGVAFWQQPINDTAHTLSQTTSVFKAGSTVPAKFQLKDANGKVVQANSAPTWLTPVKGRATTAPVDENAFGAIATSGSAFAWSSTDQQYQFNWGTPSAGAGYYWRIGVALDDGTTQVVSIALR
jgi:hypothetical protein